MEEEIVNGILVLKEFRRERLNSFPNSILRFLVLFKIKWRVKKLESVAFGSAPQSLPEDYFLSPGTRSTSRSGWKICRSHQRRIYAPTMHSFALSTSNEVQWVWKSWRHMLCPPSTLVSALYFNLKVAWGIFKLSQHVSTEYNI